MTQIQYDAEMRRLNNQRNIETRPLYQQLEAINQKRNEINQQICNLKMEMLRQGNEYSQICSKIHDINNKYSDMKHELYLQRPPFNGGASLGHAVQEEAV